MHSDPVATAACPSHLGETFGVRPRSTSRHRESALLAYGGAQPDALAAVLTAPMVRRNTRMRARSANRRPHSPCRNSSPAVQHGVDVTSALTTTMAAELLATSRSWTSRWRCQPGVKARPTRSGIGRQVLGVAWRCCQRPRVLAAALIARSIAMAMTR